MTGTVQVGVGVGLGDETGAKATASIEHETQVVERPDPLDWFRIVAAVTTLLGFLLLAASAVFGWSSARELSVLFCGYIGLGTAPLQLAKEYRGLRYALLSIGIGLATVSFIGFLLLEFNIWSISIWLFVPLCAAAAAIHAVSLKRNAVDHFTDVEAQLRQAAARLFTPSTVREFGPTVIGLALCLGGALSSSDLVPGHGGLLFSISPFWIAGVIVLIGAVALAWRGRESTLTVSVVSLLVILVATPAIVYQLPRYDWSQKHVGVTLYFLQHGVLNSKIDIYQSWPAFFGGVAWLCKAAHVANVEAIARWWPAVTDTINLASVYFIGSILGLTKRRCLLAALLFTLGNTIGQDYFSPQSAAFVLFLLVFALCLHPDGRAAAFRKVDWALFVLFVTVIAVTHQLTPFATVGILLVFTVCGLTRRRSLPIIAFVPTAAWALTHLSQIRQYFNVSDIGNVAVNVQTTNTQSHYHYIWYIRLGDAGQGLAPVLVGAIALIALITWRQRVTYGLAAAAAACTSMVAAIHYGNEDIYRATLFALPWLALLAGHIRVQGRWVAKVALPTLLALISAAYVIGDMGFDDIYVTRPGDVAAALYFEQAAPDGSSVTTIGSYSADGPRVSPRYPLYTYKSFLDDGLPQGVTTKAAASTLNGLTSSAINSSDSLSASQYVLGTQQAAAQLSDDGVMTLSQYRQFESDLVRSGYWRIVYKTPTAELLKYQIVPG
jgi:hypothetical protein